MLIILQTACIGLACISLIRGSPCNNEAGNDPSMKYMVQHGQHILQSARGDQAPRNELGDATHLTPEHKFSTQLQELPISTNIPQKRRVGSDAGPPESAKETYRMGAMDTKGLHTQTSARDLLSATDPGRQHTPQDLDSIHGITRPRQSFEAEPEMLLQPKSGPISHEQLVVEVKGIYAGLVMVEAKCIDIDERPSFASEEKDPGKRTPIKNDQWQPLIALHKQV